MYIAANMTYVQVWFLQGNCSPYLSFYYSSLAVFSLKSMRQAWVISPFTLSQFTREDLYAESIKSYSYNNMTLP